MNSKAITATATRASVLNKIVLACCIDVFSTLATAVAPLCGGGGSTGTSSVCILLSCGVDAN